MAVVLPNVTESIATPFEVPLKDDKSPYRFEMLFNGYVDRAYADTAGELLGFLIRNYARMTDTEKRSARLHHAVRMQTKRQADLNYSHDNLRGCTPEEQVVLSSSRATPPDIREWSCEVPIILVDVFYEPVGKLPRPISTFADVENPPNILWVRPEDEYEYLISLANIGAIDLNEHVQFNA